MIAYCKQYYGADYGNYMIIAAPTPKMYISVGGKETTGFGDGAGAAAVTPKAASEYDGQHDSVPPELAVTLYFPGTSGCQSKLYTFRFDQ